MLGTRESPPINDRLEIHRTELVGPEAKGDLIYSLLVNKMNSTDQYAPELTDDIELELRHQYLMALELAKGKDVLDIASGGGYGSAMLATGAASVIGVDISEHAVEHARARHPGKNLKFIKGDCANIPLPDSSVDLVVSFETIEHRNELEQMMKEIKRVLRKNGLLLISSSDKFNYSVEPNYKNPRHVNELFEEGLKAIMGSYFSHCTYYMQRIISGSAIIAVGNATDFRSDYSFQENEVRHFEALRKAINWIALASDMEFPDAPSGIYESYTFFARHDAEIATRDALITGRDAIIADRDAQASLHMVEISNLKRDARKNEIERYRLKIDCAAMKLQHDREISEKDRALTTSSAKVADLTERLQTTTTHHASIVKALEDKDSVIQAIWQSRSMRLTKPFRIISNLLRNVRRALGTGAQ